jgi:hypothetical protein
MNPELTSLFLAVMDIDDKQQIVPRYLPEGYTCAELKSGGYTISAVFAKNDSCIFIHYLNLSKDTGSQFEYDPDSGSIYMANGIKHIITTNKGLYSAVWETNGWECSIMCVSTESELQRMIDSIYMED